MNIDNVFKDLGNEMLNDQIAEWADSMFMVYKSLLDSGFESCAALEILKTLLAQVKG